MEKNKKKSVFVDTSAWLALFFKSDKNHAKAAAIYEKINMAGLKLYTSDYVINETITFVMAKGGHKMSLSVGEALLTSPLIEVVFLNYEHLLSSWNNLKETPGKQLSLTDATSFRLIRYHKILQVFSFDRRFIQAGFKLNSFK